MDDRIDLSPLDPSNDRERWEELVGSIATRAVAARRQSPVLLQLVAWSRPALAVAAGLALAIWGVSAVAAGDEAAADSDPAYALSNLADADELPSASLLLQLLGGENGDL
jgi:hypothetical protein